MLRELMEDVERLGEAGNIDEMVARQEDLVDVCVAKTSRQEREERRDLWAAVATLAVDVSLLKADRTRAERVLTEFFSGDPRGLSGKQLTNGFGWGHTGDASRVAGLAATVADYLFREHAFERAYETAATADRWHEALIENFPRTSDDAKMFDRLRLGRLWNLARWARISWRCEQRGVADELLERCEAALSGRDVKGVGPQRLDNLEGFALDVWASIDWARGRLEEARRKSYRAVYLLGRGNVKDTTRRGYALFTAGKIEATLSGRDSARRAIDLLECSRKAFEEMKNPLAVMPTIQRAETLVKAGEREEAKEILQELENTLVDRTHRAEAALAWCWIHYLEGRMDEVIKRAQELIDGDGELPSRLVAEGYLQRGRALVDRRAYDDGIRDLKEAYARAVQTERIKIEVAAALELAAAYEARGDEKQANGYWEHANTQLTGVRSAYLESRRDTLSFRLRRGWVYEVRTTNYDNEVENFRRAFMTRAVETTETGTKTAAASRVGVARSTVVRVLGKDPSRVKLKSRRGRKGKRRS